MRKFFFYLTFLLSLLSAQTWAAPCTPGGTCFDLSVSVTGAGSVTAPDDGIDCGTACTSSSQGDVLLTASPADAGMSILWSGNCSGSATTCSLTMSAAKTVTVTFTIPTKPRLEIISGNGVFGDVTVNTEKVETITVKNTGSADISDLKLEISGTGFSQISTCTTTLAKEIGECQVKASFRPTQVGDSGGGTLKITATGADGSPKIVTLSGKGIAVAQPVISPSSNLVSIADGQSRTITIKNGGTGDLKDIKADLVDFNKGFVSNNGCAGQTLIGNTASCDITVNFSKLTGVTADQTTTLKLTATNATGVDVALIGTVVIIPAKLNVSPTSLNAFAETEIGQTSTEQTITISNTGDAELTNLTIGEVPTGFTKSTACGTTLAKAGTCAVVIKFAPQIGQTGIISGKLIITSADNSTGFSIDLSGTVKSTPSKGILSVSTNTLDFGDITVGQSVTRPLKVTNNSDVDISDLSVLAINNAAFSITQTDCKLPTLLKRTSCNATITFKPTQAGNFNGSSFEITATAEGSPQRIILNGKGLIVSSCNQSDPSTCKDQTSCQSINGTWNVTTNTCISCSMNQTSVNSACISTDLMKLKLDPVFEINQAGQSSTSNSVFLGGVGASIGDLASSFSTDNQNLKVRDTISVSGMIVPKAEHVGKKVDILVVGLHLPEEKLSIRSDACDPNNDGGNYYVNTRAEDIYCFWIADGHNTNECNSTESNPTGAKPNPEFVINSNRRSAANYNYWKRWEGKLDELGLPALATGTLTNQTNLTGLYTDKLNYTGHVCINFGYRLKEGTDKGTIVFNGAPIKYRVSSSP